MECMLSSSLQMECMLSSSLSLPGSRQERYRWSAAAQRCRRAQRSRTAVASVRVIYIHTHIYISMIYIYFHIYKNTRNQQFTYTHVATHVAARGSTSDGARMHLCWSKRARKQLLTSTPTPHQRFTYTYAYASAYRYIWVSRARVPHCNTNQTRAATITQQATHWAQPPLISTHHTPRAW
jgi:hypothetical protein